MPAKSLLFFASGEAVVDLAVRKAAALYVSRNGERPLWAVVSPVWCGVNGTRTQPVVCQDEQGEYEVELRGENIILSGHVWVGSVPRRPAHFVV